MQLGVDDDVVLIQYGLGSHLDLFYLLVGPHKSSYVVVSSFAASFFRIFVRVFCTRALIY